MKKRHIERIGKTLIVIATILLLAVFPGSIILSFIIRDADLYSVIFKAILFSFFIAAFLVYLFMRFAGDVLRPPKKTNDKFDSRISDIKKN